MRSSGSRQGVCVCVCEMPGVNIAFITQKRQTDAKRTPDGRADTCQHASKDPLTGVSRPRRPVGRRNRYKSVGFGLSSHTSPTRPEHCPAPLSAPLSAPLNDDHRCRPEPAAVPVYGVVDCDRFLHCPNTGPNNTGPNNTGPKTRDRRHSVVGKDSRILINKKPTNQPKKSQSINQVMQLGR